ARALSRREARVRPERASQPREEHPHPSSLRRVREDGGARRRAPARRAAAVLASRMAQVLAAFAETVKAAGSAGKRLPLRRAGTKDFYGQLLEGEILDTRRYVGIVAYDPTELVITVCGGTRLAEVEAALAAARQMLPFEPPHLGGDGTGGGAGATGPSGPRRAAPGGRPRFVCGG